MATIGVCPITPGTNLTYTFRADEYGSSWYHAHYSAQYTSGLLGPMVIHGPSTANYDIDIGPVLVTDWFHDSYEHIIQEVMAGGQFTPPGFLPQSGSNLINGIGQYPCANVTNGASCTGGSNPTFQFTPGKSYRMRFVNTGASAFYTVSIDNHTMTVIANDYTPVQPYTTQNITLGVGQRTDVIVTATGEAGESYWLRAWNSPFCGETLSPDTRAIILYDGADPKAIPTTTGPPPPTSTLCENDALSLTVPAYAIPASSNPSVTLTVTATFVDNSTGSLHWELNGIAYEGNLNKPLLLTSIAKPGTVFEPERNVYDMGDNATVRMILYNTILAPHPMHLHGHDFRVLATGFGTWDGSIVNAANPQRRDVQMLAGGANASDPSIGSSYIVLEWDQDNPGVWPFHCHIAWHLASGMNLMLLERPDDLASYKVPQTVLDTCTAWNTWEETHVVNVVDDGLRKRSKVERAQ